MTKSVKKILDPLVTGARAVFVPGATFWSQKIFGLRFHQFWCQKICISKTKTEQKTRDQNIYPSRSYEQKRLQKCTFCRNCRFCKLFARINILISSLSFCLCLGNTNLLTPKLIKSETKKFLTSEGGSWDKNGACTSN